jgi:nitroimidazol reductase NimA-like FMN-containing flavoprotein (pyridoxamine 5'-phosphate oxidase superfamily)
MHEATVVNEARLEELPFEECLALLRGHEIGRIAVIVNEFPVVVPVSYRFVEAGGRNWIAFRTRAGSVTDRGSMQAAFQLDCADAAQRSGWSVLVSGTLHRVDPDAADFRNRFDPQPWVDTHCDIWFIVDPMRITGRRLHAA